MRYFKTNSKRILSSESGVDASNGEIDYRVEADFSGGSELQGPRSSQEDRMVSYELSELQTDTYQALRDTQKETLIQDAFKTLTNDIADEKLPGGSTVISAWVEPTTHTVWSAGLGDSEIFAIILDKEGKPKSVGSLNDLHNPDDAQEQKRLTQFAISKNKTLQDIVKKDRSQISRLGGAIAVSRSLGDIRFEPYGMSHVPSIKKHEFGHIKDDEKLFIVLACDGLTEYNPKSGLDCLSKDDIGLLISKNQEKSFGEIAEALATAANVRGSRDNISVQITEVTGESVKCSNPFMLSVFDGHGGQQTVQFVKENFTKAYLKALAEHQPEILNESPFVEALSIPTPELDYNSDDVSTAEIEPEEIGDENSDQGDILDKTNAATVLSAFGVYQKKIETKKAIQEEKIVEEETELHHSNGVKSKEAIK